MPPIPCDACRQPTIAHDVVKHGSMAGGHRLLCGRCFNEAAAGRLGLQAFEQAFEQVGFETVLHPKYDHPTVWPCPLSI